MRYVLYLLLAAALALLNLHFGVDRGSIAELAVGPVPAALPYPEHRDLELRFSPTAFPQVGGCPTVFAHLVNEAGKVARTFDHRVPRWGPGEAVSYRIKLYQSAFSEPLPAGRYDLVLGLYDPDTGERSALATAAEAAGKHRYRLGSIAVGGRSAAPLPLDFAGAWREPEAGTDAQIASRRWLHRSGSIAVGGGDGPVVLWLQWLVPAAVPEHLVLAEGALEPRLEIVPSCAAAPALFPVGRHELELEIPPAGCELELRANFAVRFPAGLQSAALEAVAFARPRQAPAAP